MLFCPNCGKSIDKNDKFCKHCGTSVFTEETDSMLSDANMYSDKSPNTLATKLKNKVTESVNKVKVEFENQTKETREKQEQQQKRIEEKAAARKERRQKILAWIKGLDKRIKIGIGITITLIITAVIVWIYGFKKPYDEAVLQFDLAVSNYDSAYEDYKAQVNSYNEQLDSVINGRKKVSEAIRSIEDILNNPEIEDAALLEEMRKKTDSYIPVLSDEIVANPVVMLSSKEYSLVGLKTDEIRSLTGNIMAETEILKSERERISGMSEDISNVRYNEVIIEINDLKNRYNEAVKIASGLIYAPKGALIGKNYADVAKLFMEQGFTDVKVQGMGDLIIALLYSDGEVAEVSLGGLTDYGTEDMYDSATEVIIRYHSHDKIGPVMFGEENNVKEETSSVPESLTVSGNKSDTIEDRGSIDDVVERIDDEIGNPLPELVEFMKESGFKATYIAENSGDDFTDWIADEPEIANNFLVYGYGEIDESEKKVIIYIEGMDTAEEKKQAASNEDKLNSKLDEYVAWNYVELYGKKKYPYGFKLHYMLEKYAATAEDENTWFLKAGCTVTNAFGAKADLTCEARISGTESNPKIVSFSVY